jgi:hypothetical protein
MDDRQGRDGPGQTASAMAVVLAEAEPQAAPGDRLRLAMLVAWEYVRTRRRVDTAPLQAVTAAAHTARRLPPRWHVKLASRAVDRLLAPRLRPTDERRAIRCVHRAVVLHRILVRQGVPAAVVIGLPAHARDTRAHAWVEVAGVVVGPPPGRSGHVELVRYD